MNSRATLCTLLTWAALVAAIAPQRSQAENVDPDHIGQHLAWSENAGWLDAQPGGPGSVGLHAHDGAVTGWLWSENLGWISASCSNTNSCGDVDYGLTLDPDPDPDLPGVLRLVGKAWSENAGWIVTHCAATASCNAVDYGLNVAVASGIVVGHAWSENVGWISFSCANSSSCDKVDFGLQFDPAALQPPTAGIFADGLES